MQKLTRIFEKTAPSLKKRCWLLTGLALFLLAGCDVEDEPIPAFLTVKPFQLNPTNPAFHGSVSEKITNAKVFLIDKASGASTALGVLSLPASVPVLESGDFEINIDPVIKANGNSLYLTVYPFYVRHISSINLSPEKETIVQPVTTYSNNLAFEFIEDFEGGQHLFKDDRDDNPLSFIEISNEDVFEGGFSGHIALDTAKAVIAAATELAYSLDFGTGGKFFMELNYKTDVLLEFGVLTVDVSGTETPNFEFAVLPKDEWNKIYFDLTDIVSTSRQSKFIFILRAGLPFENGKYALQKADIYLDNIKFVHF